MSFSMRQDGICTKGQFGGNMKYMTKREPSLAVDRIQGEMDRLGLKPGQVADLAGISYETLYKILNNQRPRTSAEIIAKLAAAFSCSMEYLMGMTDEREPMTIALDPMTEELAQLADRLPSRRKRDLLVVARAYLDDNERAAADPDRLFDDLIELFELYGSKTDVKRLLNLIEYKLLGDSTTPLLGDNTEQEGESDD